MKEDGEKVNFKNVTHLSDGLRPLLNPRACLLAFHAVRGFLSFFRGKERKHDDVLLSAPREAAVLRRTLMGLISLKKLRLCWAIAALVWNARRIVSFLQAKRTWHLCAFNPKRQQMFALKTRRHAELTDVVFESRNYQLERAFRVLKSGWFPKHCYSNRLKNFNRFLE